MRCGHRIVSRKMNDKHGLVDRVYNAEEVKFFGIVECNELNNEV